MAEPKQETKLDPKGEKRMALLKEMELFRGLRESELAALLDDLRLREYAEDESSSARATSRGRSTFCSRARCASID